MEDYYRLCGFDPAGSVPQYHPVKYTENRAFIPRLEYFGDPDFIDRTLEALYPGFVVLPDRTVKATEEIPLQHSTVFISSGSPQLTYAKRMGFVEEVEPLSVMYQGCIGLGEIRREFDRQVRNQPRWSKYRVVREPPSPLFNGCIPILGCFDLDMDSFSRYDDLDYPTPSFTGQAVLHCRNEGEATSVSSRESSPDSTSDMTEDPQDW